MKKILSAVFAAAIGASMTLSVFAAGGDLNSDGKVDILDVVNARGYIVGNSKLTDEQISAGDMNGDGALNIVDVVEMRSVIVGVEAPKIDTEKLAGLEEVIKSENFSKVAEALAQGKEIDISAIENVSFEDVLNDEFLANLSKEMGLDEPITTAMLVRDFKINDLIDWLSTVDFTGFEEWLATIDTDVVIEYYTEYEKVMAIEDFDEWSEAYDAFVAEYEPKMETAMNVAGLKAWIDTLDTTGLEAWANSIGLSDEGI